MLIYLAKNAYYLIYTANIYQINALSYIFVKFIERGKEKLLKRIIYIELSEVTLYILLI